MRGRKRERERERERGGGGEGWREPALFMHMVCFQWLIQKIHIGETHNM